MRDLFFASLVGTALGLYLAKATSLSIPLAALLTAAGNCLGLGISWLVGTLLKSKSSILTRLRLPDWKSAASEIGMMVYLTVIVPFPICVFVGSYRSDRLERAFKELSAAVNGITGKPLPTGRLTGQMEEAFREGLIGAFGLLFPAMLLI